MLISEFYIDRKKWERGQGTHNCALFNLAIWLARAFTASSFIA